MSKKLVLFLSLALAIATSPAWTKNGKGNGKGADPTPTDEQMIILHKPGTPAEKVMTIPVQAWAGHERHGDRPYEAASLCSVPTTSELAAILEQDSVNGDYFAYATISDCTEIEALVLLDASLSSVPLVHPDFVDILLLCEPVTQAEGDVSEIIGEEGNTYTANIIYACTIDQAPV